MGHVDTDGDLNIDSRIVLHSDLDLDGNAHVYLHAVEYLDPFRYYKRV
jgi:hypothetical protein